MATAFVTGGTGFLVKNLIRELRARGDRVVALHRPTSDTREIAGLGAELLVCGLDDVEIRWSPMRSPGCARTGTCAPTWLDLRSVACEGRVGFLWYERKGATYENRQHLRATSTFHATGVSKLSEDGTPGRAPPP